MIIYRANDNRKRMNLRLSNNQSRLLYDSVCFLGAALVAILFSALFRGEASIVALFALPLGVASNILIGIYSKYRVARGPFKVYLLSATVAIVSLLLIIISKDLATSILWGALVWAPLVLPRYFLNLRIQPKLHAGAIGKHIAGVVKDRGPVLVVGGAGYIGSYVVSQLLKEGYRVRVLDRLFYGRDSIKEFVNDPKFEIIEGDVTDIGKLVLAVNGASAIVHMAGLVGDPACAVDENYTMHCNVIATRMLKEVGQSYGVQRFIFCSSCSVYGISEEVVNEESPLNPVSLYARTKIESEKELLSSLRDDFFVTILRFATVFGHSRRPRYDLVINLFTAQAFFNRKITVLGASQWRPFIHVSDLARAIVMTLKADPEVVQGQVFNVGDEKLNYTIGQVGVEAKRIVSKEHEVELVESETTDRRNYSVSFEKIQRKLGFRSTVTLEQGIVEMVESMKRGEIKDFRNPVYSNLEITRGSVQDFHDPDQASSLYAPIAAPLQTTAAEVSDIH